MACSCGLGQKKWLHGSRKTIRGYDSDVYKEVPDDPEPLINTIHRTIEKIKKRGDFKKETIKSFEVKDPKFARFYLLPKIHKQLNNVPGRPFISNWLLHSCIFRLSSATFGTGS